jgi:YHS domain-containing protein
VGPSPPALKSVEGGALPGPSVAARARLALAGTRLTLPRMATDPVCGMEIEEAQAPVMTEFEGRAYYFCSESCRDEFEANPTLYAVDAGASPTA